MAKLFTSDKFDAKQEFMFFGRNVNVARYDEQRYPVFEKLIEKQLSFFWRPDEVDISRDRGDFHGKLSDAEQHIFLSNLKYQTLLDSIQGRAPNLCLLPVVSLPELETWIETWSFSETIHSRSYTHIIRNIINNPSEVFDDIVLDKNIISRAESATVYGDKLIDLIYKHESGLVDVKHVKKALYLYIASTNILEAVRFYVSFACSFAFAERTLMEGNAKIIKLISRDEALHMNGTQHMLNLMASGRDDPEMADIAKECESDVIDMFSSAAKQEKEWAEYLFKDGSMIGLNSDILGLYVEYITNIRMKAVGLNPVFDTHKNPIPWINAWLSSDNVQVAPQEAEISSYLVGQIDSDVNDSDFDDFDL